MSKLKKILLMGVSYALIAALAIGGTLAYLQDSDEAVNVMTLGNVSIEQIEQERDANGKLVPFTQAKPAYPAVGPIDWADELIDVNGTECKVFTPELKNVVDKIVTINNVGKTDAFVRTIVALEAPGYDPQDLIHINYNDIGVTMSAPLTTEIKGVEYVIFTFTYTEALAAGAKSAPSLIQLFLDKDADNEFCAKFGTAWEVLTLSQGVQAAGFADAQTALNAGFGEVNAANAAKWFGADELEFPALVEDADEFWSAVNSGEKDIIVNNANDIVVNAEHDAKGANMTFNGGTVTTANKDYTGIAHCGEITYNNVTFNGGMFLYGEKVVFNNCTFNLTTNYIWTYGAKEVEFNGCTFNTDGKAILYYQEGSNDNKILTVKDCTFNATKTAQTWNGIEIAAVSIDGSLPTGGNGTYTVNFEGTNTVDADFNGLWQIKAHKNNVTVNE